MRHEFTAPDYFSDEKFQLTPYAFEGSTEKGWQVKRHNKLHLDLGPGYRLLQTLQCGVCSTDLARKYLPFPLPQVTGHEVVVVDESGNRYVSEIHSSHATRGEESSCLFCNQGLSNHCPERIILGIHDLPGGFSPRILAPVNNTIAMPDAIATDSAVLIEPFAAALNAVTSTSINANDRVAVLGPKKLGQLVIAALSAYRNAAAIPFSIIALSRRDNLLTLAKDLGADEAVKLTGKGEDVATDSFDIVFDTTGNPVGLEQATRIAKREVHLKSTHGLEAAAVKRLYGLVVDELNIGAFKPETKSASSNARVAWLCKAEPPKELKENSEVLQADSAKGLLQKLEDQQTTETLPRVDIAVIESHAQIDEVIRPDSKREVSLVRPRGEIQLLANSTKDNFSGSPLSDAIVHRGLRLSSSRCGNFRQALDLMVEDAKLSKIGESFITHRFNADQINRAFEVARSDSCIKAIIEHH